MDEMLEQLLQKMREGGNYVDFEIDIDGKICLDGWFDPVDIIKLGFLVARKKGKPSEQIERAMHDSHTEDAGVSLR